MESARPYARIDLVVATLEGHRSLYLAVCGEHALRLADVVVVHAPGGPGDLADEARFLLEACRFEWYAERTDIDATAPRVAGSDLVLLLDADSIARSTFRRVSWPLRQRVVGLSLRGQKPRFTGPWLRIAKSIVRYAIVRRFAARPGVEVIDLVSGLDRPHGAAPEVADPVPLAADRDDGAAFRDEHLGGAGGRRWLGLLGVVNARKNTAVVADAIASVASGSFPDHLGLLIAGPVMPEAVDEVSDAVDRLEAAGVSVVVIDRFLTDVEFDAAIAAVDAVVVAYSNDGPSGILAKAGALGTAVAAAGSAMLRDDVERHDLGGWGPLDAEGVATAVRGALERADRTPVTVAEPVAFARRLLRPPAARVLAWPATRQRAGNSFTARLADELDAHGWAVEEFDARRAVGSRADVVLLHWPEFASTHARSIVRLPAAPALLVALTRQRRRGARVVWVAHNARPHRNPSPRLHAWFMTQLLRRLDGWLALSEAGSRAAIGLHPALAQIPNRVIRHPAYEEFRAADAPERLGDGRSGDRPRALVWGKIERYKQVPSIVDLVDGADGVSLVVAGRCDDEVLRSDLLAAAGPAVEVELGRVESDRLRTLMAEADVAVFNFSDITTSGSVLASLSAGLPVIVPRCPVFEELEAELEPGWVRLFDAPLSADVFAKLAGEPRPDGAGLAADPRYAWTTVGSAVADFLRSLTAGEVDRRGGLR